VTAVRPGAWWLLAGLTLLNVLNFADRFLIISFGNSIIRDLELTKFEFTLLTGLVFSVFYTLFGLFAGALADRYSRPRLIAAGLALWSALTAATAAARGFFSAAAARVFIGVGEAVLTPAALSMLADSLPAHRRSLAAGIYFTGLPIGIGSSFIFAGLMGPVLGWRGTFVALGAVGILAALLMLLVRDPPRGGHAALGPEGQPIGSLADSARGMSRALRTTPALLFTLAGSIAAIFAQGGAVLDIVWWVQERGYAETRAQQITGAIFLAGGVTGAVLGGIGADWAWKRFGPGGRVAFLAAVYLVVAPAVIAYRFVPPETALFYLCTFIGSVAMLVIYGPMFATVQELVPVNLRGAAIAVAILCNTLIGHAGGSALAGYLADAFTAQGVDQPLTWALLISGLPGLLAIPAFAWAARLQSRMPAPPA
jgi:MFS transporter, Spinster family, sphingosine-1-phosphate transporter